MRRDAVSGQAVCGGGGMRCVVVVVVWNGGLGGLEGEHRMGLISNIRFSVLVDCFGDGYTDTESREERERERKRTIC